MLYQKIYTARLCTISKVPPKAGLTAARQRGKKGGRPKALNSKQREIVVRLYNDQKNTVKEICEMMKISKPTLYSYLRQNNGKK